MKRVDLSVDLSENEVFEKEVESFIRAKVREAVRNEHSEFVVNEVHKEIDRLFNNRLYDYRGRLKNIIRELTMEEMRKVILDMNIESITKESVGERIEHIVSRVTADVELRCNITLEKTINSAVQEKLSRILGS